MRLKALLSKTSISLSPKAWSAIQVPPPQNPFDEIYRAFSNQTLAFRLAGALRTHPSLCTSCEGDHSCIVNRLYGAVGEQGCLDFLAIVVDRF